MVTRTPCFKDFNTMNIAALGWLVQARAEDHVTYILPFPCQHIETGSGGTRQTGRPSRSASLGGRGTGKKPRPDEP